MLFDGAPVTHEGTIAQILRPRVMGSCSSGKTPSGSA